MRAFISSVIGGFEDYREAAASACQVLRHDVLRAEDWPARSLLPQHRNQSRDMLAVAVACGPEQQVLQPEEIEAHDLCEDLKRDAMFGPHRVIDSEHGARCTVERGALILSNDQERIVVDPQGGMAVHAPARRARNPLGLNPIIEEEIRDAIATSLSFIGSTLDRIDPTHRLRTVVPVVTLSGAALGWKTRAEHEATPNTMGVGFGGGTDDPISLQLLSRPRQHLAHRTQELADDFTLLLRRQVGR